MVAPPLAFEMKPRIPACAPSRADDQLNAIVVVAGNAGCLGPCGSARLYSLVVRLASHVPPPCCLGPAAGRMLQRFGFRFSRHAQHSSPRSTDMRNTTRHAQHRCASGLPPLLNSARTVRRTARPAFKSGLERGANWGPPSRTARVKSAHASVGVPALRVAAVTPPRCRGRACGYRIRRCLGAESLPTRSSVLWDACTRLSKS